MILLVLLLVYLGFCGKISNEVFLNGTGPLTVDLGPSDGRVCFLTHLGCIYRSTEKCSVDPNLSSGPIWDLNVALAGGEKSCFGCGSRCYAWDSKNVAFSPSTMLVGSDQSIVSLGPVEDRFCYITRIQSQDWTSNCQVDIWYNDGRDPSPIGHYWVMKKTGNAGGYQCRARCMVAKNPRKYYKIGGAVTAFNVSDEFALANKGPQSLWLWPKDSTFCYISQAQYVANAGDLCFINSDIKMETKTQYWRLNTTSNQADFRCGVRCVNMF